MFSVLVLKVGVAELTLLGSKVLKVLGTVICVAQLELIVDPWAVLTTIRWTVLQSQKERSENQHFSSQNTVQFA